MANVTSYVVTFVRILQNLYLILSYLVRLGSPICTKVNPILIADQRNLKARYLQNDEEN